MSLRNGRQQIRNDCYVPGDGGNLRLLMIRSHFRYQAPDAPLELTVLGSVDERVVTDTEYRA